MLRHVDKEALTRRVSDKNSIHLLNQRAKHREKMPQTHARVSPMRMVRMQWASRCPQIQRRLGNTDLHSSGQFATARSQLDEREWNQMVPAPPQTIKSHAPSIRRPLVCQPRTAIETPFGVLLKRLS